MIEAGVVIDLNEEPLHWHLPPGRSGGSLPDSRNLWDVLWENRERIAGFAHSHPGSGVPGPSHTDVTTFAAIEAGLGKRLSWWITSSDRVVVLQWAGLGIPGAAVPDRHRYRSMELKPDEEPSWVVELRRLSTEWEPAPGVSTRTLPDGSSVSWVDFKKE